ncbi:hypothetical protein [Sphingomonas sp. 10B4]|uniref:hypothetical protein n=1 Tax=Sphingomonas sp. 10B4 TaxID=3048575 RepID=UPI002AB52ED6|nr:hypothetical protein [Sphingomonas sp. 10B4]MDY7525515.1 hypothetical protein [Sphingomonas sp. 10B4]MEB0281461.1 hypothetical protein [Sphingomonas sp. 10B4]
MENPIDLVLDKLGGTSAVAQLLKSNPTTVHAWRKRGITESRLDHLRLAARERFPAGELDPLIDQVVPLDRKAAA